MGREISCLRKSNPLLVILSTNAEQESYLCLENSPENNCRRKHETLGCWSIVSPDPHFLHFSKKRGICDFATLRLASFMRSLRREEL